MVEEKQNACNDKKCPYHGNVKVRGATFIGKVISAKPTRTVTVERTLIEYVPKFERYKKKRSRIHAHNPECVNAKEGDTVLIGETRKLSKTKSFVVLKVLGEADESDKR
ncbi:MAG: 30S ribosomal protein S17 [Candidatus Diapherotrites archaeon]|nr:30S ribosomal protein S17 [Candidatus Diapherotrites archaeon]